MGIKLCYFKKEKKFAEILRSSGVRELGNKLCHSSYQKIADILRDVGIRELGFLQDPVTGDGKKLCHFKEEKFADF